MAKKKQANLSGFTDEEISIFKGMLYEVTHENEDCCTKPFYQKNQEDYNFYKFYEIREEVKKQKSDEALDELASFAH